MKTNVIRLFLKLIDKHFPRNHPLHKCFNRNTVKATYCTLTNMKQKIAAHNSKLLNRAKEERTGCNCRNKELCPIPGECNQTNVVYQAKVVANNKSMFYFGSTKKFKSRYAQHKSSFNNRPANHTTLSSYIWKLKDRGAPYTIEWSIKSRGHAFSSGSQSCDLCITEKLVILTADQYSMLNKKMSYWKHAGTGENTYLLQWKK